MLKTLRKHLKGEWERFKRIRSVGAAIPIKTVYPDGIFLVGKGRYAKSWRMTDINYSVASNEDQKAMFLQYSELLNSFDSQATTKLTIATRKLDAGDFQKRILIPFKQDGLDKYRDEYNSMLMDRATGASSLMREIYLTTTIEKRSIAEARTYFRRMTTEIGAHTSRLGSRLTELDATEKLRLLHSFYRQGEEAGFTFDMTASARKGHSFKDAIAPESLSFHSNYFMVGSRFGRVLYLKEYANYIKDSFLSDLFSLDKNTMLSIDIIAIPTAEAVREVERVLLGVETNAANYTRKQNQNQNFGAVIPYNIEMQRKESREVLDDLVTRDQRMMVAVVTLMHTADTLEELDSDTDALYALATGNMCTLDNLTHQQLDGMNTALPTGVRRINALRTLTTEALAVLMPFRVQEIQDAGGMYFGENTISKNLILCDKSKLLNPNSFILGVPGSGKSFTAKEQIIQLALNDDAEILVTDPEGEYSKPIKELGGEEIVISPHSPHHLNLMAMEDGYGEGGNSLADKSEFIMSLFEQIDKRRGIGPKDKSIIDRCVEAVYIDHRQGAEFPTLITFREKLLMQPEPEARELALSLELFTSGTLNTFAHPTNVDTNSRIVSYNIVDLGHQLKTLGLLVITDAILNRVVRNWRAGKRTHVFIDEMHVLFESEHSAAFFTSAWRRFRKRNAYPTAITQNVSYLLESESARSMLSNSEFIVMLNQATSDRDELARLLNISEEQMGFITNADAGSGLIRYGSSLVPFTKSFDKTTELYRLISTKPQEFLK